MTAEYRFLHQYTPRSIPRAPSVFRIEGENVGYEAIAKRLGVSVSIAQSRMCKLRGASGAITWERLMAFNPHPNRRKGKVAAA